MKTYEGIREYGGCIVTVNGRPLPLRLDLYDHSPTGFEWGYGGSGPAQLALAILADVLGGKSARRHYQDFKLDVICGLDHDRWRLTEADVRIWLSSKADES